MSVLKSQLNTRSAEFKTNAERMQGLVSDLRSKIETVSQGGDAAARAHALEKPVVQTVPATGRERIEPLAVPEDRERAAVRVGDVEQPLEVRP